MFPELLDISGEHAASASARHFLSTPKLPGPGKACVQALRGSEHANLLLHENNVGLNCTCGFTECRHPYIGGSLDQRRLDIQFTACEHMQALECRQTSIRGYICPDIWQILSALAIALNLRREHTGAAMAAVIFCSEWICLN